LLVRRLPAIALATAGRVVNLVLKLWLASQKSLGLPSGFLFRLLFQGQEEHGKEVVEQYPVAFLHPLQLMNDHFCRKPICVHNDADVFKPREME